MRLVALEGGIGRIEEDGTVAELDAPHPSLAAALRSGRTVSDLASCSARDRCPLAAAAVAPVAATGASVWGVGLNYRSKAEATGRTPPDHPVLFLKSPGAMCTDSRPIELPAVSQCVDYEGEIAVVLGHSLHQATETEARAAIAGVTTANDVTARDVMKSSGNPSLAKSFPGFGQIGSVVELVDDDEPLDSIRLAVRVNGEVRQDDSSAGMLRPIAELVALVSTYTRLMPGDVVLTGTPAGTGDESGSYLRAGDRVEVKVADLPVLSSTVRTTTGD